MQSGPVFYFLIMCEIGQSFFKLACAKWDSLFCQVWMCKVKQSFLSMACERETVLSYKFVCVKRGSLSFQVGMYTPGHSYT